MIVHLTSTQSKQAVTGITGLDNIFPGGLTTDRTNLIEGPPGSGITTLALRFLLDGAQVGEKDLSVTLSEIRDELADSAATHGWDLSGIEIAEFISTADGVFVD